MDTKRCSKCKQEKLLDAFYIDRSKASGRGSVCIECNKKRKRTRDKSKGRIYSRHHNLRSLYNMTVKQFNDMKEEQKHKCAICGVSLDSLEVEIRRRLNVDHDHETGKVRGLLCGDCNSGLGFFKDNFIILQKAETYLVKHNSLSQAV